MTQDRTRKLWRRKLHAKRCADHDQSPLRYYNDAKLLNRAMAIYKIKGALALWGKDAD